MSKLTENNLYNVRGTGGDLVGRPIEVREPTVGKWYCGITLPNAPYVNVTYGLIARYDGDGNWCVEAGVWCIQDGPCNDVDMYVYDYLQEQI